MQAAGAITVNDQIKSISAAKPSRGSGQQRAKDKRGGENVRWKRLTDNFDELVKLGANPAFIAPLARLVFFKHLTHIQGLAGLKYASIMRTFERYHIAPGMRRTTKSQSFEPVRGGEDQEIERRINNGTIDDYEDAARKSRNQHKRLMKVMDAFKDPISGRNFAKDMVESLVLLDQEPPANYRADIGRVLSAVAKEFDVTDQPKRRPIKRFKPIKKRGK